MVKLCYIVSLVCVNVAPALCLSTEYVKYNSRQVVLSKPNHEFLKKTYSVVEPKLQKRDPSYRAVKTRTSKSSRVENINKSVDESEETKADDATVNSYGFRSLQKKMGLGGKKFELPVSGPVPDWDNQYYDNDGKPIVYQVDTEELKELMDSYLEMGKEKWAAFLATSECSKFQKLMDKLHNLFNKSESEDDEDEDNDSDKKSAVQKPLSLDNDDADDDDDDDDDDDVDTKVKLKASASSSNSKSQEGSKKSGKDFTGVSESRQPLFSNIPEEEIEEFQNLLADVISYWEHEDAKSIMEAASGLSYKDFELSDEDANGKIKKAGKVIKPSFSTVDEDEDENEDDDEDDEETNEDDENQSGSHEVGEPDLLEKLDPELLKTKAQKDWLKSNALRRAKMIQKLMEGQLDEDMYMKQDEVRYRENNIFLDEDENEIPNTAFRLQSTNLAMYVFFLVEALLFYIF